MQGRKPSPPAGFPKPFFHTADLQFTCLWPIMPQAASCSGQRHCRWPGRHLIDLLSLQSAHLFFSSKHIDCGKTAFHFRNFSILHQNYNMYGIQFGFKCICSVSGADFLFQFLKDRKKFQPFFVQTAKKDRGALCATAVFKMVFLIEMLCRRLANTPSESGRWPSAPHICPHHCDWSCRTGG